MSTEFDVKPLAVESSIFPKAMSRTFGTIALALAKAQGEMKLPNKNRTVKVKTKSGHEYTFDYADLAAINEVIRDPLSKNELAYTHILSMDEKGPHLLTLLIHSSGEWFSSRYPLSNTIEPKDLGAQITYGKRYALCALIGCVGDDDNDSEPDRIVDQPQTIPAIRPKGSGSIPPGNNSTDTVVIPKPIIIPKNPLKPEPSGAFCQVCQTELILSDSKWGYYCPKHTVITGNNEAHSRFQANRLEEFKAKFGAKPEAAEVTPEAYPDPIDYSKLNEEWKPEIVR